MPVPERAIHPGIQPGDGATRACQGPPPNEKPTEALAGVGGFGEQSKTDTTIVADLDAERKAFKTLRARYALAGFALIELADGSLLASRWNLTRPLPDAHAALQFLRKIGGTA